MDRSRAQRNRDSHPELGRMLSIGEPHEEAVGEFSSHRDIAKDAKIDASARENTGSARPWRRVARVRREVLVTEEVCVLEPSRQANEQIPPPKWVHEIESGQKTKGPVLTWVAGPILGRPRCTRDDFEPQPMKCAKPELNFAPSRDVVDSSNGHPLRIHAQLSGELELARLGLGHWKLARRRIREAQYKRDEEAHQPRSPDKS